MSKASNFAHKSEKISYLHMYKYKRWNQDGIAVYNETMSERFPDCDTFFVSSMAADAELAEGTLRNYLRTDPTLDFIHQLPSGERGTHSNSMQAWGEQRRQTDGRRTLETWKANFRNHITDTSPCSAMIGGLINKAK